LKARDDRGDIATIIDGMFAGRSWCEIRVDLGTQGGADALRKMIGIARHRLIAPGVDTGTGAGHGEKCRAWSSATATVSAAGRPAPALGR
jgi:hypothetical protein